MKILAIETSCDETAVSVVEATGDLKNSAYAVLGDALYSQAPLHASFGGVYPNLAKREHQKNLVPLTKKALGDANLLLNYSSKEGYIDENENPALANIREEEFRNDVAEFLKMHARPDIDLIAVTNGPGLEPALWTGISFAEALAVAWNIPIIGINHMEGHIVSALMKQDGDDDVRFKIHDVRFPLLALLISGGHTELVLMKDWFKYELVGRTRDDAVGEAFDKVARILGLPYPGGPEIDRVAKRARERAEQPRSRAQKTEKENLIIYDKTAHNHKPIMLPRPMLREESCDFSFSGLKTAVLYLVRDLGELSEEDKENIAREFEDAVCDVLVSKTKRALKMTGAKTLVVGGGVSANSFIREGLEYLLENAFPEAELHYPEKELTGDNAVMIGIAAYLRQASGMATGTHEPLAAHGSRSLTKP